MKTFTFKLDTSISLRGMFNDFKEVMATPGKTAIEKDSITSQTIEAILTSMTKSRLDLFYCIARSKPGSLYELAKILDRDQANVLRDTKALEAMGIIKLNPTKEHGRDKLEPIALYDRIVFDFGATLAKSKRHLKREKTNLKKLAS